MSEGTRRWAAIDAHRGVVTLLMVMHHMNDAALAPALQKGGVFHVLQFLGGVPAPGFLFLAGLGLGLGLERERRKGVAAGVRVRGGLQRGLYVLGLGVLIQASNFFFGHKPWSEWQWIFRVDVLNAMGASMALVALVAAGAPDGRRSALRAALLGVAVLAATPFVYGRQITFPNEVVGRYVAGSGPLLLFPLLPWLAFVALGLCAGEFLASPDASASNGTRAVRIAGAGLALIAAGFAFDRVPFSPFPAHDYWHASPLLVLIRAGVQALLLALLLALDAASPRWLTVLGRHSLAIYWLHLNFVYGPLLECWRGHQSLGATLLAGVALAVACAGVAFGLEWRERRPPRSTGTSEA